jgi:hypothetical protein
MDDSLTLMLDPEYVIPSTAAISDLAFWLRMEQQASNTLLKLGPDTMSQLGELTNNPPRVAGLPDGDFWTIIGKYISRGFSAEEPPRDVCEQHLTAAYIPRDGHPTNRQTLESDVKASGNSRRLVLYSPLSEHLQPDPDCTTCLKSELAIASSARNDTEVLRLAASTARAAFRDNPAHSLSNVERNAYILFPDITFSDEAWSRLRTLSGDDSDNLDCLLRDLGVLNDYAVSIWDQFVVNRDREVAFGAVGVTASPEGPAKHKDKSAMAARKFDFDNRTILCEWHTKFQPTVNRIYFAVQDGKVFVGTITDHLP